LQFNLRDTFVRMLQAKSILELANENLGYYDRVIEVNRRRFEAGDLSRADFDRIGLQRAQFESDVQTARVNLTTARIQLLSLMNEHQPVDTFDIAGPFEFGEQILLPDELHQLGLDNRGDVRSAQTAIQRAEVDHRLAWANGSTDPIAGGDYTRLGPDNTLGVDVNIPLRIFDRNQGEKARTEIEIKRSRQARDALLNSVFRDIDTAYAQVESIRAILRPYRDRYLPQADRVREAVSFAYSRGGASLLEFLDAQKSYRDTQLAYRNLIASYLSAVNQLNLAVGREVLQ
jgi:outer membrane protein, heavy metal efflux system